ncbi:MAG: biotin--[acetyl-CoA-carboxylase] ligase [Asgard group archaeon]|nr:biotin--[acetyl-CoA-carboxylase] ligase [Asgard group archaeon]
MIFNYYLFNKLVYYLTSKLKVSINEFDEIDSTQKEARRIAAENSCPDFLIIIAQKQTAGIGRLDRTWASPKGGLWLSVLFKKKIPVKMIQGFSVRLGLEIIKILEKNTGLTLMIKWPNDLILNHKKVGGSLIETKLRGNYLEYLIIGIGVNVNISKAEFPKNLTDTLTTISTELNEEANLNKIKDEIIIMLGNFLTNIEDKGSENIRELWKKKSHTYKRHIAITIDEEVITGHDIGITNQCELIVRKIDGSEMIISQGEIQLLRIKD